MSRETCEALVAWLIEQKIIHSDRPWKKVGIALKKGVYARTIALEGIASQTRERYKALVEVAVTLNAIEKYHADGHMADGFIKVLGEQMEEQLHIALTHRLSSTVGKTLDTAATIGLDVCMREYDNAVEAQTKATLDELSKRKRLFKLPDRTPVQPWEKDRIADEPVYVPLYKRYPPTGGDGGPYSGSGLVKPEYQWLSTMSGAHPTPKNTPKPSTKPAVASGKAPQYVDPQTLDSTAAVKSLTPSAATEELSGMIPHEQLKERVDASRPKGLRESTLDTMEQWAAENPAVAALCAEDMLAHHQVSQSEPFARKIKTTVGKIADDVTAYREERAKTQQQYHPKSVHLPEWVDAPGKMVATGVVAAGSAAKHVVMPVVNTVIDAGVEGVKATAKGAALRDAGLARAAYQFGGGPKPTFTPDQQLEHVDQDGADVA